MISEPRWQRPNVVKQILATKIQGIDLNAAGRQLTALNLLRTAVRTVPDLVVDHLPLPSMEDTLHQGNSLSLKTLSKIQDADVAILNPPFHGARRWDYGVPKRELPPVLRRAESRPNQAFAMLLSAIHVTRAGGRIGCVFPSQLMSGLESTSWRRTVASKMTLEAVIENYGNPFPDVQSYAGLLWGRKLGDESDERPRTRVIRVDGAARFQSSDIAAVFAGASQTNMLARQWIREPIAETDGEWLQTPREHATDRKPRRVDKRISLSELTGGNEFHQAPVPAPEPWGRILFFFKPGSTPSEWQHAPTDVMVRGETSSLRPIAMPNFLMRVPQFCEPTSKDRIFLPGDGTTPVSRAQLSRTDPVAAEILMLIRATVQTRSPKDIPESSRDFVELVRGEKIAFWTRKGYEDTDQPLLIAAKATRSNVGKARDLHWSCWLNEDGKAVPLGGIYCRVSSFAVAVATSCWLNLPDRYPDIFEHAARRNLGTRQPRLTELSMWQVPAINEDKYEDRVAAMMEAFTEYQDVVREKALVPNDAAASKEYRDLLSAADGLWR
jgi:hypothetical protein